MHSVNKLLECVLRILPTKRVEVDVLAIASVAEPQAKLVSPRESLGIHTEVVVGPFRFTEEELVEVPVEGRLPQVLPDDAPFPVCNGVSYPKSLCRERPPGCQGACPRRQLLDPNVPELGAA